jgi:hypothetical protein
VFSILFSPLFLWFNPDYWFLSTRFGSGLHACPGGVEAVSPRLMGLPARPPGLVPHVDASEYRLGLLDRHHSNGAIFAAMDLLNDERTHCDVSELRIELDCGFHFEFSFFYFF